MSSLGPIPTDYTAATTAPLTWQRVVATRLSDYAELAKPRIAVMALVTVAVGYVLAAGDTWNWSGLLHALGGIGLAAVASASCSASEALSFNRRSSRRSESLSSSSSSTPPVSGLYT